MANITNKTFDNHNVLPCILFLYTKCCSILAISTHVWQIIKYFEILISLNIFQPCSFHPFQQFWKYYNFRPKTLDIWNIACNRDDEMQFFWPSNLHMMFHSIILLAKPMFRVNKPLLILEDRTHAMTKYSMAWHGIFVQVT